jgi:CheY-like chemotaxis protein
MPKELLIADANVTAQEEFERIFEGMDAQLIFAENGEDALLKIKLYKPDLVIADVTMPNKDGFELCKIVKANSELQQIPFVLLAGIFEEIDQSEQDKIGADGVVTKPLSGEKILPLVTDLLKSESISPQVEAAAETGTAEAGSEETLLSMEELSTIEEVEEVELPHFEEIPETQPPTDEGAIIELTEVVDEETSPGVRPDESVVDTSQEHLTEGQEKPSSEEEVLDEMSFEGIDLEAPEEELELAEAELTEEGGPEGKEGQVEETQTGATERVELEIAEENHLDQEQMEKPSDRTVEAELEEEIDQRIDLVLEEEQEEEDTLLELEEEEVEKTATPGVVEEPGPPLDEIAPSETPETGYPPAVSFQDEEETLLELGESEEPEETLAEEESSKEPPVEGLEGVEEETLESLPAETSGDGSEEQDEPSEEALEVVSDDLEELSMEELEGLGETLEELEDLPVEEELEGLFGEGAEEFEELDEAAEGEPSGEDTVPEELEEVPVQEDSHIEEVFEKTPDAEDILETVDAEELVDIEPEEIPGALDAKTVKEEGEESLEDLESELLEEGLGEGEDTLEEPLEKAAAESVEPFSYPNELIKEGDVSEKEVDAFQKRLTADLEDLESDADVAAEAPDERIESLVRKGVEQVLNNLSESVIPELTKTLVQVASERIEKVVQRVVPELAESAIKKEIERLQKEG